MGRSVFYACLVAGLLLSSAAEIVGQTASDEARIAVGADRLVAADSHKRPLVGMSHSELILGRSYNGLTE